MAWIESHQELAQHPKTKRLARALGVSVPTAIGHLHLFWWWALSYALAGDISDIEEEDVADAALWEGDAGAFVSALRRAGFVDDEGQIHDWEEYSGKWQERRNANAARVRAHRERARNAHVSVTQPLGKGATGPNLTGPNLTGQLQQAVVVVNAHDGGADAPTVTAAAATTDQGAKGANAGFLALSEPARAVVDDWRSKQGKKRPPKLNPAQVEEIELAVAELGAARLCEANTWAARNGVPEIVKAIRAARTKRQRDEDDAPHSENLAFHPEPDGACGESLAPPSDADAALWEGARADLATYLSGPNFATYIAPLGVAGRAADGGLRLRAPPGLTTALKRFRSVIVRSLDDAGDPRATRVAIVEARPGQE